MNKATGKKISIRTRRILISACGVLLNTLLSFIMYKIGIPLYFDTLGTIAVAAITGYLFPAICTAVCTSVFCSFFYWPSIYLAFFNAIIAVITVAFVRKYSFKNIGKLFIYVLAVTVISALSVSVLQFVLNGLNDNSITAKNAFAFSSAVSVPYLFSLCITNFMLYFLEKCFISLFVILLTTFIPKTFLESFDEAAWSQKVISDTARQYINDNQSSMKNPLHKKIALTFVLTSMILVVLTEAIALRLYFDNTKKEKTQRAYSCVNLAADFIDPDRIDDYLKYGTEAEGYDETLELLTKVHHSYEDIAYLYVLKIEEAGGRFIFDTDEEEGYAPGELVPFDPEFEKYLGYLFEGKEIEPVQSDNILG